MLLYIHHDELDLDCFRNGIVVLEERELICDNRCLICFVDVSDGNVFQLNVEILEERSAQLGRASKGSTLVVKGCLINLTRH